MIRNYVPRMLVFVSIVLQYVVIYAIPASFKTSFYLNEHFQLKFASHKACVTPMWWKWIKKLSYANHYITEQYYCTSIVVIQHLLCRSRKSLLTFNTMRPPFYRRHCEMHFRHRKYVISVNISLIFVPMGLNWQHTGIGLGWPVSEPIIG